jgi:hypothetical protein
VTVIGNRSTGQTEKKKTKRETAKMIGSRAAASRRQASSLDRDECATGRDSAMANHHPQRPGAPHTAEVTGQALAPGRQGSEALIWFPRHTNNNRLIGSLVDLRWFRRT